MNDRPLSHAQCLAFLRGIASALDAIHARGLVHRDLKPSNIFVCRDDDGEVYPKLIDFGIAKDLSLGNDRELTTSGSFIGTPAYMSPEQCLGKRTLDARSDIYALGVVAYQMLAGHPPFDGVLLEVAHAHAHTPAPSIRSASLPASLDPVFAQILAKDPEARPGSASDAIELLAEALAAPDAPVSRPRRRILAVAVAAIAIGAAVWIGRADDEPPRPPPSPAIAPIASIDAAIAPLVVDAAPEVIVAPDAVPAIQKPKTQPKRPSIDDVESLPSN
jgi:serine/threonine-protein kinase